MAHMAVLPRLPVLAVTSATIISSSVVLRIRIRCLTQAVTTGNAAQASVEVVLESLCGL